MAWTDPFASFNSVTLSQSVSGWGTPQAGSVVDYEHVMGSHAVHWMASTATPSANGAALALQGSLDGANFYDLGASADIGDVGGGIPASVDALVVSHVPARYVRAVATLLDSGSISATALIISEEGDV